MPIPIDEFPELIFGKEVFARDVSSLECLVVQTIAGAWKAYADDHFHFLIRANGPYDSGQPQADIDRLSVIRGNENHQCAGTLGMRRRQGRLHRCRKRGMHKRDRRTEGRRKRLSLELRRRPRRRW